MNAIIDALYPYADRFFWLADRVAIALFWMGVAMACTPLALDLRAAVIRWHRRHRER